MATNSSGEASIELRAQITAPNDGPSCNLLGEKVTFFVNGNALLDQVITIDYNHFVDEDGFIVIVSLDYPVQLENGEPKTLSIDVEIGPNFVGSDDGIIAVVYRPSGDHITGGGFIIPDENSAGLHPSEEGTHANFGFNFRYHPRTGALQGEANLVIRNDQGTFQFKSTQAVAMGIGVNIDEEDIATFTVKGQLRQGNNVLLSDLTLNATMIDRGNPGIDNDEIGFTIWNGNQLIYSSNWNGVSTVRLKLSGGNIVIHRGGTDVSIDNFDEEITNVFERETAADLATQVELNVFPNPFREKLFIRFTPVKDTRAVLELYDMNGALVQTLFDGDVYGQERYEVEYIPRSRNSAVLFYRLRLGTEVINGKIIHQQ